MISMQNICWRRDERTILNDVNLQIKDGEQWIVLGRNGSGKTSLLEMMTGYMFPTSGVVHVLGNRFGECDVREVRKEVGYISQSMVEKLNLGDPVWEVVATGEYAFLRFYQEIDEKVKQKALRHIGDVGLEHLAEQPFGTLSQGERKKILLARSLMSNPKLLIMDEPCAGLDLHEREKLLADLGNLQGKGITMVYVTHHLEEIISLFTHVAIIKQGEIMASGPKHEVVTAQNISDAYDWPVEVEWANDRPWVRPIGGGQA